MRAWPTEVLMDKGLKALTLLLPHSPEHSTHQACQTHTCTKHTLLNSFLSLFLETNEMLNT